MENGWIKLDRNIINQEWFKDGEFVRFWIYINCQLAHTKKQVTVYGQNIELQPGEMVFGRKRIALELNISESKIERMLKRLQNEAVSNRFQIGFKSDIES